MSITRDEWLQALADAGVDPVDDDQGAISIREFCGLFQLSDTAAVRRLNLLVERGKARKTKKWIHTPDGRRRHVIAYRLMP